MLPHSPQRRVSLPFAVCRLPSPAPPASQTGARSSTSGVRGGDNGSGAGGAGRQLTGVCGFASWPPSRPAWALWGVGEPAASPSQSWRAKRGPVRGAVEAQHVKKRRLPVRGERLSRPGWLRRPSSSRSLLWQMSILNDLCGEPQEEALEGVLKLSIPKGY